MESEALDLSAEYDAYPDDSREGPAYTDDSLETPAYTEDSLEAPIYPPRRNDDERGLRADASQRRGASDPANSFDHRARRASQDGARFDDPLDDPRAPRSLRASRPLEPRDGRAAPPAARGSRPLGDAYGPYGGADDERRGREPQPTRSRPYPDDYAPFAPGNANDAYAPGRRGAGDDGYGRDGRNPRMPQGAQGSRYGAGASPSMPGRYHDDPRDGRSGGRGGPDGPADPFWEPRAGGQAQNPMENGQPKKGGRGGRVATAVIAALLLLSIGASVLFVPSIRRHIPGLSQVGGAGSNGSTASSFATYTPGPTPTVLPNDKLFTSAASRYAMDYPSSWTVSTTSSLTQGQYDNVDKFVDAKGVTSVGVEQAGAFVSYTDSQIIQGEVAAAQQGGAKYTPVANGATTQSIGGEVWQRADYSVQLNGVTLHMAILACHHIGKGYVIVLVSENTNFATDQKTAFEPMLGTFRFT